MLAKRLKAARTAKRWTQEELGKKVNTTKGTISNYENGHSTPSNEMLLSLAAALDTSVDYLLGNPVDNNKRIVRGEEIDLSDLTENQRTVLDWAMQQESLSAFNSKQDLLSMLDDIALILKYESEKKVKKGSRKN